MDADRQLHGDREQHDGEAEVERAGAEREARLIAKDMANEPAERLETIRQELEAVTTKDFWEIIDRGRNFEYMPETQRKQMATFFGWLGVDG